MKNGRLIILICAAILVSCDKSIVDIATYESTGSVASKPKDEMKLPIQNELRLWCRETPYSFDAISEGEFTIKSQDESIASVSVEGKRFTVKTHLPGETLITIADHNGNEANIVCHSCTFHANWLEDSDYDFLNSYNVIGDDQSVVELIKKELAAASRQRNYYFYFSSMTNKMKVTMAHIGEIDGEFEWDIKYKTLTLRYLQNTYQYDIDGKLIYKELAKERYYCDILPECTGASFIIALTQDLTHDYVAKYPHAGIKDAYIIRHTDL